MTFQEQEYLLRLERDDRRMRHRAEIAVDWPRIDPLGRERALQTMDDTSAR